MTTNRPLLQNRYLIVGALSCLRVSCWIVRDTRTVRLGLSTLIVLMFMSKSALAFDLAGTAWAKIGREEGIDPLMLYAVALTESGRPVKEGQIEPWPWALNVGGDPIFAASREEAAMLLAIHGNKSVDVGLLQVNIRWHGYRVDRLESLLDPKTNLGVGAAILKEALASAPGDLTVGIGRYHSARPKQAKAYARTVLALYRHLLHQQNERISP
jgi:soluble lytic murein transglycosylase-like protein